MRAAFLVLGPRPRPTPKWIRSCLILLKRLACLCLFVIQYHLTRKMGSMPDFVALGRHRNLPSAPRCSSTCRPGPKEPANQSTAVWKVFNATAVHLVSSPHPLFSIGSGKPSTPTCSNDQNLVSYTGGARFSPPMCGNYCSIVDDVKLQAFKFQVV